MADSKYFDLDTFNSGWSKEDSDFATLALEAMSTEQLEAILKRYGIDFGRPTDEFQMISAIFAHADSKDDLLAAIRETIRYGKAQPAASTAATG